jgi:hypothetical protein
VRLLLSSLMAMLGTDAPSTSAAAPRKLGFTVVNLVLYQPDAILRERAPSVPLFGEYVKLLEAQCFAFFAEASTPEIFDVVVVIRPRRRSKVWFVSSLRAGSDLTLSDLRQRLEGIRAPDVRKGPIAFAISGTVAGALRLINDGAHPYHPPLPTEWREAAASLENPALVPDGILEAVWPEKK